MKIFGMCFDRRVLLALGAAAIGLWAFAPEYVARIAPLLLLLACPLSMVFMMRGMGAHQGEHTAPTTPRERLAVLDRERERIAAEIAHAPAEAGRQPAGEPGRD